LALAPGARLGIYDITAPIGEGGMGQVFRATDTKLKRQVAIKILPPSLAADHDRLGRFQREAELLASLNHPNIAGIFGFEESSGVSALVMELVEGDDLSQRIARGAVPLEEALPIAKQILDALEAAHEQSVIHRDLKPANIKVRRDGTVKVLDFGLAKAIEAPAGLSSSVSMPPTLTTPVMTQAGMILGTAAYMSPEQARGTVVDKRADLWAFGVVLWEMLTGARPFDGHTVSDTIAAVLRAEPDWTALPANTPAPIRRLLRRCLDKDRSRRLDSAAAARLDIDEALTPSPAAETVAAPPTILAARSASARALTVALAVSTLAFAISTLRLWAPWRPKPSPRTTALRFTPFGFEPGGQWSAVWSPDGKAVAFAARQRDTDPFQIYVRYLESPVATAITRVTANAFPIAWTTTGRIIFRSEQAPAGLWSVSPVGGEAESLQAVDSDSAVSVSRDGTAAAVLRSAGDGAVRVWISAPPGTAPKPYEPAPFASRDIFNVPQIKFSPDGKQILLIRNGGSGEESWLMPYPADTARPPNRILEGLPAFRGTPTFSWMPDNRHVVLSTTPGAAPPQLYMADTVSGTLGAFSSGTTQQIFPAVSPDGNRLVFVEAAIDRDVVSVNLTTAAVSSVITTQRNEQMPAWASKDAALVYVTDRNGDSEIWLHKPGQSNRPLVTPRDFPSGPTQFFMSPVLSPDATRVIYSHVDGSGSPRLWMSAVAGGSPAALVKSSENDFPGSWSPDGNWFVYCHTQDGRTSLNKVKTTGQAAPEVLKVDLKISGNWVPVWSPAGDWILYSDGGVKLVSPDGRTTRDLSSTSAVVYAFSADGDMIYGMRGAAGAPVQLFSMSISGGSEKIIGSLGPEYLPSSGASPALRLTLTPDGKSITYSTRRSTSNLWLMEGLNSVAPP